VIQNIKKGSGRLPKGGEMDTKEIWNEICFLLSDNIKPGILEKDYENQVIRAIEKFGWREFTGEIKRQPELRIGRNVKVRPDVLVCEPDGNVLVVIEIKRPAERLSKEGPADQLISYMLQTKAEFGLLIGSSIRLFYDGKENPQQKPLLLNRISFEKDSEEGQEFVTIFHRNEFLKGRYKSIISKLIKKFTENRNIMKLREILLEKETHKKILEFLKDEYAEYGSDVVDGALIDLKFELSYELEPVITPPLKIVDQGESFLKTVFDTIKQNQDGISKSKLVQLTGLTKKQISNQIYRLTKRVAITTKERGVYVSITETIPPKKKKLESKPKKKMDSKPTAIKSPQIDSVRQFVYDEINKHESGCTKDMLIKATGLNRKQISNAIYSLSRRELIHSIERGVYVASQL